jgi:8-oxo-dGTP pyrophosphatase MutT (NUDIX family)
VTTSPDPARITVGSPSNGTRVHRRVAVRALAVDAADRLLVLRESGSTGLKLPGGGVEAGEDDHAALTREVREEAGYDVSSVDCLAVVVEEHRPGNEPGVVLAMESRYYRVTLGAAGEPELEVDELALGLTAVWLSLDEALELQRQHMAHGPRPWAARELAVLTWLADQVMP